MKKSVYENLRDKEVVRLLREPSCGGGVSGRRAKRDTRSLRRSLVKVECPECGDYFGRLEVAKLQDGRTYRVCLKCARRYWPRQFPKPGAAAPSPTGFAGIDGKPIDAVALLKKIGYSGDLGKFTPPVKK